MTFCLNDLYLNFQNQKIKIDVNFEYDLCTGTLFGLFLQGNGNKYDTLQEGCSAQVHNAVLDQTKLDLQLLNYLDQNWKSEYHIKSNLPEISFTTFSCITELDKTELDIAVHVTYTTGQMVIAIHSPYWMVNKTGRMLQYKADGIHRKHPPDYKKPLLFSFQPKNFLQNNKVTYDISVCRQYFNYVFCQMGSRWEIYIIKDIVKNEVLIFERNNIH